MNPTSTLPLLGGLSPAQFMRRHWQKKPLLVRNALLGMASPLSRTELFALATRDEVQSRLVRREGGRWSLVQGPFARRALPPLKQPRWTLLVQGVDQQVPAVHQLMQRFRFLPDARLDDAMVSYASDGGGVGPHFDSYDVFLIQLHGRRRWRIARDHDRTLQAGQPLRLLRRFRHEEEFVLDAGDMLYLPPNHAHDGVAEGECLTCSIGFRAPGRRELGAELLQRMAETWREADDERLYRDPSQAAVDAPARVPPALQRFSADAVRVVVAENQALARALGEYLSEPKPGVWFTGRERPTRCHAVVLDAKSRMLYDEHHVYLNGESFRASGMDARLMRSLADQRQLEPRDCRRLSAGARSVLYDWMEAGWMHGQ